MSVTLQPSASFASVTLQPSASFATFGRDHVGTDVSLDDVSTIGEYDVKYLDENGGLIAYMTSGVQPVQLKLLEDTFATKAQSSRSQRFGSTGSLVAGYFDTRDVSTSKSLERVNSRSVPRNLGKIVCRSTRFTATSPALWRSVVPVLKSIGEMHEKLDPVGYGNQMEFLRKALCEYRIADTAYTTLSVNYNLSTKIHVDKGDYEGGSGCIVVAGRDFEGGQLCFPRYRIAFPLRPGDLIVCSVHEWHGNLPLKLTREDGFRLSHVLYARAHIPECDRILDRKSLLGVPWSPTSHEERFREYVERVKEYVDAHGKLPATGVVHRGMKIGEWVHNRRSDHRKSRLSREVEVLIQEIPMWTWSSEFQKDTTLARAKKNETNAENFEANMNACRAFFEEMSYLPRTNDVVFQLKVGKWLDNRKQDLKKNREIDATLRELIESRNSRGNVEKSRKKVEKYRVNIAIPSYSRAETLRKKTIQMLMSYDVEPGEVTVFVIESQVEEYSRALKDTPYTQVVSVGPEPGLAIARNFIRRYYDEGLDLLCIDDDVVRVSYVEDKSSSRSSSSQSSSNQSSLRDVDDFRSLIRDGFIACRSNKARLWGIYPAQNPFFMTRSKISTGLKYIVGSFWGVINTRSIEVTTDDKEDVERTLRHYVEFGKVVRLEYVTVKTLYYKEPGGMQVNRTKESNLKGAMKLAAEFPDLCRVKIRHSTGLAELVLKDGEVTEVEE